MEALWIYFHYIRLQMDLNGSTKIDFQKEIVEKNLPRDIDTETVLFLK